MLSPLGKNFACVLSAPCFCVNRFGLKGIGKFGAPLYAAEEPIHIVNTYARYEAVMGMHLDGFSIRHTCMYNLDTRRSLHN